MPEEDFSQEKLEQRYAYAKKLKERLQEIEAGLTQQDKDIRHECEQSLSTFIKYAWKYMDPSEYIHGWHIDAVCAHLEAVVNGDIRNLIINQPPRTAKSLIFSVALTPWVWAQEIYSPLKGADRAFLYSSYAQTLSFRDSMKARRLISSPWYQKLWGNRFRLSEDMNTKGRFTNDRGGHRIATSVGGQLTGDGGNFLCFPYETKILTDRGSIEIGRIVEECLDVKIAGLNGDKIEYQSILGTKKRQTKNFIEVSSNGGIIECTPEHPIFVVDHGYIEAKEIICGQRILQHKLQDMQYPNKIQSKQDTSCLWNKLRCKIKNIKSKSKKSLSLQNMRQEDHSLCMSFKETSKWAVLQSQMLIERWGMVQKGEIYKTWKNMRKLFQNLFCFCIPQKISQILFKSVQMGDGGGEEKRIYFKKLCSVWEIVSWSKKNYKNMLFKVQAYKSANCRIWRKKLDIQKWKIFKNISERMDSIIQKPNSRKGQASLSVLWSNPVGVLWKKISRTSYRLQKRKFKTNKFNNPLSCLSFLMPRRESKKKDCEEKYIISTKEKTYSESKNVYNLNVAPHHNYFANGILVHNCIDDAHNSVEVESDLVRQGVLDWFDTSLSTRKNSPKTDSLIVVMQRLHSDDLTGHILDMADDSYTHLMLPMRYEPNRHCSTSIGFSDPRSEEGELLWPERLGEKEVKTLETALGPFGTSGQLQQSPMPKGGGIIKEEWWMPWITPATNEFPPLEYIIAVADTAYTEAQENDYSACVVLGVYRDNYDLPKIMVLSAWQERLGLNALVLKLAATAKKFKVDRLLIENKASGISVAQEIRRLFANELFGILLVDPKGDKVARLMSVEPLFAEGIVHVPYIKDENGNTFLRDWTEVLIKQVTQFPKSSHDDLVDCISAGIKHLRDNGLIVRREERNVDLERQAMHIGQKTPLYDI